MVEWEWVAWEVAWAVVWVWEAAVIMEAVGIQEEEEETLWEAHQDSLEAEWVEAWAVVEWAGKEEAVDLEDLLAVC